MYVFIYSIFCQIEIKQLNDKNNYYNQINYLIVELFYYYYNFF